jgi:hypothetical protein
VASLASRFCYGGISITSTGCAVARRNSIQSGSRYLAAPGGMALPRVAVDVTALIAGGLREIVRR